MKNKFFKAMYYLCNGFEWLLVGLLILSVFGLSACISGMMWKCLVAPEVTDWQAFVWGLKFTFCTLGLLIVCNLIAQAGEKGKKLIDEEKENENGNKERIG